jgi:hypothetical protein
LRSFLKTNEGTPNRDRRRTGLDSPTLRSEMGS